MMVHLKKKVRVHNTLVYNHHATVLKLATDKEKDISKMCNLWKDSLKFKTVTLSKNIDHITLTYFRRFVHKISRVTFQIFRILFGTDDIPKSYSTMKAFLYIYQLFCPSDITHRLQFHVSC